jgi:hypothetical protein
MRKLSVRYSVLCGTLATLAVAGSAFAANTHIVVAQSNLTWKYGSKTSTPSKPVMVDDLMTGDIIEIQVPGGSHGFITIKRTAGVSSPTEITDPVLACGETAASKPNAVLREIACGTGTNFNKAFTGSLKLEVLPTFTAPVDFYCFVHKAIMPGTLKLKPAINSSKKKKKQ